MSLVHQWARRALPFLRGQPAQHSLTTAPRSSTSLMIATRQMHVMARHPTNSLLTLSSRPFFWNSTTIMDYNSHLYTPQQAVRGFASKKHKNVLRRTKGFRGRSKNCFRIAILKLQKSWQYAYRDRKAKKRNLRKLWIQQINAGARQYAWSYSRFINHLGKADIQLNRKVLAGLASHEPFAFKSIVDVLNVTNTPAAAAVKQVEAES